MLWTAEEQFGPGNPFAQIQTSGTHDFTNWTHVLVQRIGNNASNWKIYINGVSVAFQIDANQLSSGDIGGLSSSSAKLGLGGFIYDGSVYDHFRGDLKQVRLYKRALSATEISANFANTCSYDPVSQSSLVFWAPLREATTSVSVGDISSTGSTGTHSGSGNSMSRTGLTSSTCGATPAETCVERENGYRYSINTQEKVDEISGEGNHTTAEFWEYDSRLGRRWNVDPKPNPSISLYACFGNSPIWKIDPNGDTIRLTEAFKNNKLAMEAFAKYANTKAGEKFLKEHQIGGKYGNELVVFDIYTEEETERNSHNLFEEMGKTEVFSVVKGKATKLITEADKNKGTKGTDKIQPGGYKMYRISLAVRDATNTEPRLVKDYAHTLLHESQHKRIINYTLTRYGVHKWNVDEQHYIMRTNKEENYFYDFKKEKHVFHLEIGLPKDYEP